MGCSTVCSHGDDQMARTGEAGGSWEHACPLVHITRIYQVYL